ncbi:unnamed protein product [Fraxinus pennsylvanica]|uniref:Uncharacterized protein n=1 Tax=Fraxinus pennsylvanica TaxID=56036 RepID=A0AAD2E024_9LAMI|nr:unnamed protein product [Fraxinus pennsylvanica]
MPYGGCWRQLKSIFVLRLLSNKKVVFSFHLGRRNDHCDEKGENGKKFLYPLRETTEMVEQGDKSIIKWALTKEDWTYDIARRGPIGHSHFVQDVVRGTASFAYGTFRPEPPPTNLSATPRMFR